jgi:glycyl-tRNA synthetase
VDATGQTIGKRYARTDEIGIPFAITVDFDTLNDNTVTLRELLTLKQVRIPVVFYLCRLLM